jgi:hypothetical protein
MPDVKGPKCDFWLVCHSKDFRTAVLTIESIFRYSLNPVGRIFVVGNELSRPAWLPIEVEYIYEGSLPVAEVVHSILEGVPYKGWVFQQLLKYSGSQYSIRFVTIDCDTVLLKPHLFFMDDETVLRISYEYSSHYRPFEKSLRINAGMLFSYTCHMMPYKSDLLDELKSRIREITGQDWAVYICNFAKKNGMVVNEYDLYARYILGTNEKVCFHPWLNKSESMTEFDTLDSLCKKFPNRNSISFHNNEERKLVIHL